MPLLRLWPGLGQGQAEGQLFALAVVLICQVYGTEGGSWVGLGASAGAAAASNGS